MIIDWLERARADTVAAVLRPHVRGRVLDVGCWNGEVASRLGVEVVGLDVKRHPRARVEVVEYDGRSIPFADKSFDTVLCCAALHHALDQDALLEEMKRVGRRVVVLEDDVDSLAPRASTMLLHFLGSGLVDMPWRSCGFRASGDWRRLFAAHGLRLLSHEPLPGMQPLWACMRHHLFVLEPG